MARRFFRWLFIENWVSRLIRNQVLEMTIPGVVGVYFAVLGIWDESWIILNYREKHDFAFAILVGGTVAVLFWRAVGDAMFGSQSEYVETLEELLISIEKIISAKIHRFQLKSRQVRPNSNVFKLITHPEEQIRVILEEAKDFLARRCGVAKDSFDITVIRNDPYSNSVQYYAKANRNWEHTAPSELLREKSAASKCLETGEDLFIPDKQKGIKDGVYFASDRDRRNNNVGSLFCRPIVISIGAAKEKFLVTFATYGQRICDPADREASAASKLLFGEFARRIELELMLFSIKAGRDQVGSGKSHGGGRSRRKRR